MLNGFQTDLSSISCEIQTLQQQSVAMSQRLKNRQAVRGELSQFVDEMVIPDVMITLVLLTALVIPNVVISDHISISRAIQWSSTKLTDFGCFPLDALFS